MATSYLEMGSVYAATGRAREALELFGKALDLRRAASGEMQPEVADILRRTASARSDLGDDEQALVLLDRAEAIQRATLGDRHPHLAGTLVAKGNALWGQGRFDESIEAYEQAIAILEGRKDAPARTLAAAYLNLGNVYWSKGDYDETLALYQKTLPLQVAALGEAHPEVGLVHYNLAVLHLARRDYDAAIASAERALKIYLPAFGERHPRVVQVYNVLGSAFTGKGDPDRALEVLEKALAIQDSLSDSGDRDAAVIYTALGDAYRARGDFTRAAARYREAVEVGVSLYGERHPDVAEDLVHLGDLYLEKGEVDGALAFFERAIAANDPEATGPDLDLDPPVETAFADEFLLGALTGAARARARRGAKHGSLQDLERAALVYEHASRLIGHMRAGYRAEGSKLFLAENATAVYDEAIQTEVELHRLTGEERHLERAFAYAEKSKAGVLRDALNEAEARAFAGIPPELLEQERQLRTRLAGADRRLTEAQTEGDVEETRLEALRDQQFALKREYEALQQRFEKDYPEYYDLKHRFETVGTAQIRERALDETTTLVEYFLGKERVFIFTITTQGLNVTSVAREASLEAEVQRLRKAIAARDRASYVRGAHQLYLWLLAPVEGHLEGKDLVVVPDGLLSILPFEALLAREGSPDSVSLPSYVLRDHAVSYAYSATVLLQGLTQKRRSPPDELVAFAPAVGEGDGTAGAPPPLPASRKEVTDVRRLFTKRAGLFGGWFSGRSRVYLGNDATEIRLKAAGLERYRYVHLATHGVVDEEHPGLSRLLLEKQPGSGEDGVLHLGEVYNLRLNADLVVLSACDTGRGQVARGEGIIGLTRGFLYAGAKSLLVSLWPVSDAATAELVVDFYDELLAGRPKARALREAKLHTMGRNPEYAKPYYWSSLVLVGQAH